MQTDNSLTSILVIVFSLTLVILGTFFFILVSKFYNKLRLKQKEALSNIIIGQNAERERISRDLHDEFGPTLSTIILTMDGIKSDNELTNKYKENAKNQIKDVVNRIRQISHNISSYTLNKYGLVSALQDFIDTNNSIKLKIELTSNCEDLKFNNDIESHLYKITQELIQNTLKHSSANISEIKINFDFKTNYLTFEYIDNGKGYVKAKENDGIGLKNIKTRVELMEGKMDIIGIDKFYLTIVVYDKN